MRIISFFATLAFLTGCDPSQTASSDIPDKQATEEAISHWNDGAWSTTSRVLWTYERAGGEPTLALNQSREGSAWANTSKDGWVLDIEGRQVKGATHTWSDGKWTENGRMTFVYDKDGNKVTAVRQSVGENGIATNADSLASTFTGGLETERRFFRWLDGAWAVGLRQTSAFDIDRREIERVHLVLGAGGWEEQRRWTFAYDEVGRLANSVVEQVSDGTWTPWLNQKYTHDANGNQTEVIHEEWADSEWTNMMRNETQYDATQ